jgi:four helix bundle protein
MKENVLKERSYNLAVRIINLNKYLLENRKEHIISNQILRSGTSVGAMVREAEFAESLSDFIHKMSIAQKEINETMYWMELLSETKAINDEEFKSLYSDATNIIKLITASIKTAKAAL